MERAPGTPGEPPDDDEAGRPPSTRDAQGGRHHTATQAGAAREASGSPRYEDHGQPAKRQRLDDGSAAATGGGEQEPAARAAPGQEASRYSQLEAAVAGCTPADLARLADVISSTLGSDIGRLEAAVAGCSPADLQRLVNVISWDRRAAGAGGGARGGGDGSWVVALQAAFNRALQGAQPEQAQGVLSGVQSCSGSAQTGGGLEPGREAAQPGARPPALHALASTSGSLPSALSHLRIPSATPGFLSAPDGTASAESHMGLGAEAPTAEQQPSSERTRTDGASEGGSEQLPPPSRGFIVSEWGKGALEARLPATSSGPKSGDSSGLPRAQSRNFRVYSNTFQQQPQPALRQPQPQPQPQPGWGAGRAEPPPREPPRAHREEPHARQPPAALLRVGSSQMPRLQHHPAAGTVRRSEPPAPQAHRPAPPARPAQPALPAAGGGARPQDAAAVAATAAARFAVPTEPEALARWLQQRYSSLGAALSSSEAHLSSLGSHTLATLPLVLARLQAAQELQGRAAAAGGLPAAAALIPLLHFQALAQSIGSSPAAAPARPPPQTRPPPPALPVSSPFASLEAWRKSFSPQTIEAAVSMALAAQQEARRPREAPPPAGPAADIYAAYVRGRADAAAAGERAVAAAPPPLSGGREWPSASRWTDPAPAALAISQAQAARAMPDPHNPFEMHRISLARAQSGINVPGEAPPTRPQLPPTHTDNGGAQVSVYRLLDSEDELSGQVSGRSHRSAPPFTSRNSGEARAQLLRQPTAATVVRAPTPSVPPPRSEPAQPRPDAAPPPPTEGEGEGDEQAAETLLSLFGPGGQEAAAAPAAAQPSPPVRRQRTHRVPVAAIATLPGRAEGRPASMGEHTQIVKGLLGSSLDRRPGSGRPRPGGQERIGGGQGTPWRGAGREAEARPEARQAGDADVASHSDTTQSA